MHPNKSRKSNKIFEKILSGCTFAFKVFTISCAREQITCAHHVIHVTPFRRCLPSRSIMSKTCCSRRFIQYLCQLVEHGAFCQPVAVQSMWDHRSMGGWYVGFQEACNCSKAQTRSNSTLHQSEGRHSSTFKETTS
jgi:hypothetical protein